MYTRKQQMEKVNQLDRKVDAISAKTEQQVSDYLAEKLAQVVYFNQSVLEAMKDVLTKEQQKQFFDLVHEKMDKFPQK